MILSDYIYNRRRGGASAGVFVVAACPVCLFLMGGSKVGRKGRSFFINVNYKSAGCVAFGSDAAASRRYAVMFRSVCYKVLNQSFYSALFFSLAIKRPKLKMQHNKTSGLNSQ